MEQKGTKTVVIFIFLAVAQAGLQAESGRFLNGGMFYHVGAGEIRMNSHKKAGLSKGLGGRIALTVAKGIRVGAMGFSTEFTYRNESEIKGSYAGLGFGGITLEAIFPIGRAWLSGGFLAGMGSVRHLHIISQEGDQKTVTYERYATWIFMPLILAEFPLNRSISLAVMADWILGTKIAQGRSFGPRLHVGLLFNR